MPKKHESKGFHTWGSTSTKTTHSNVYVQHVQCPCHHAFAVLHRLTKSPYPPSYNLNISPSRCLTVSPSQSHRHTLSLTPATSAAMLQTPSLCPLRPQWQYCRPKCSHIRREAEDKLKGGEEGEGDEGRHWRRRRRRQEQE